MFIFFALEIKAYSESKEKNNIWNLFHENCKNIIIGWQNPENF